MVYSSKDPNLRGLRLSTDITFMFRRSPIAARPAQGTAEQEAFLEAGRNALEVPAAIPPDRLDAALPTGRNGPRDPVQRAAATCRRHRSTLGRPLQPGRSARSAAVPRSWRRPETAWHRCSAAGRPGTRPPHKAIRAADRCGAPPAGTRDRRSSSSQSGGIRCGCLEHRASDIHVAPAEYPARCAEIQHQHRGVRLGCVPPVRPGLPSPRCGSAGPSPPGSRNGAFGHCSAQ